MRVVFDLDNTLRDSTIADHAAPTWNDQTTEDWLPWQMIANYGDPIPHMVEMFNMCVSAGLEVHVVTSSQHGTAKWLEDNGLNAHTVVERESGDNRSPYDYKRDYLTENYTSIHMWFDDDMKVCKFAKSLGVNVYHVNKVTV